MALDRNTGLPVKTSSSPQSEGFSQGQTQTTGPRTDTSTVSGTERTSQAVSASQNAVNTTPQALAALNTLLTQLQGTPAQTAKTQAQAEAEIPLLVKQIVGGYQDADPFGRARGATKGGTIRFKDPVTGRTYSAAEGEAINKQREQQRKEIVARGPVDATPAGTPEQRLQQEQRQQEIARNRAAQGEFSKEAAATDAQALVNKSISDALEKTLPSISRGLEGAGTSKGSAAALLTQKAALEGGVEGAALGANLGVAYGGIQNQLASVLELLTRNDPNDPVNLLLQTIIGSKGLVQEASSVQSTTGTSQKTQQGTTKVGPQTTMQDTLRQILEPLSALSNQSPAPQQPVPAAVSPNTGGYYTVNQPAPDSKPSDNGIVVTPTENSVYNYSFNGY